MMTTAVTRNDRGRPMVSHLVLFGDDEPACAAADTVRPAEGDFDGNGEQVRICLDCRDSNNLKNAIGTWRLFVSR